MPMEIHSLTHSPIQTHPAPVLTLRAWQYTDIDHLAKLANNKAIWNNLRDYFPHPYTRADANKWIRSHSSKRSSTHYAIIVNGELAGAISIIPKEDIYRKSAEIGYWIGEAYWRKGIATMAVEQVLRIFHDTHPDIIRIFAEVFAENIASMKVLQKNGFILESVRKNAVVKNGIVSDDTVWVKLL
jgi:[ribosomal protein S5]-alanine N-acetyltransferase